MIDLDALISVVAQLRSERGCPWDRAQTPQSMARYVIEESHELVEALEGGDWVSIQEELGDLLFIVALIAQMADEAGAFDLNGAARIAADKMVRRHPAVFGHAASTSGLAAWEARKAAERAQRPSALHGIPKALPALLRAEKVGARAAAVGFDWPDASGPRAKIDEELAELDQAIADREPERIAHELGDVLLSVANLGRHLPGEGAEAALRRANQRFERRFAGVEERVAAAGLEPGQASPELLERFWAQAKAMESL